MSSEQTWQHQSSCHWLHHLAPSYQEWLVANGSLTQRLQTHFGTRLEFKIHDSSWRKVHASEQVIVSSKQESSYWIRTISFHIDQHTVVLARTVMPHVTMLLTDLESDSSQSIGKVLFQDIHLNRMPFEYKLVGIEDSYLTYWPNVATHLGDIHARRSIFYYQYKPLLITELFLPAFSDYCHFNKQFSSR